MNLGDYIDNRLLPAMHQEKTNTQVTLDILAKVPGLETAISDDLVCVSQSLCHNTKPLKVAFATEAGLFQQANIPTIICGPGLKDPPIFRIKKVL